MPESHDTLAQLTPIPRPFALPYALSHFIKDANKAFGVLNELIEKYNEAEDSQSKLEYLYKLYLTKKNIGYVLPLGVISDCPEYIEKIHYQLFSAIKTAFSHFGIHSLQKDYLEKRVYGIPTASFNPASITEIIANMAPEKLSILIGNLSQGSNYDEGKLRDLYQPEEPGFREFKKFLQHNTLCYLGGGNAKNFKITANLTGHACVLKVDYRLGHPQEAENHLRANSLKKVFTTTTAERQGSASSKAGTITCSVVVTEYCNGSDLLTLAEKQQTDLERTHTALLIYSQMSLILAEIGKERCAFPDMKNTNWLISQGFLKLADAKSIVYTDEEGILRFDTHENFWYRNLVATPYMNPPELSKTRAIHCSADKMHAYMLGKNIYQYLTVYSHKHIGSIYDGRYADFSATIFQTETGKAFKSLIIDLVRARPEERLSISEAINRLHIIRESQLFFKAKDQCRALIDTIETHRTNYNQITLDPFIRTQKKLLNSAKVMLEVEVIQAVLPIKLKNLLNLAEAKNNCRIDIGKFRSNMQERSAVEINQFMHEHYEKVNNAKTLLAVTEIAALIDSLLQLAISRTQCLAYLATFNQYRQGEKDGVFAYMLTVKSQIEQAKTVDELVLITAKLKRAGLRYEDSAQVREMKAKCELILEDIKHYKFSNNDAPMDQFIATKNKELDTQKKLNQVTLIKEELVDIAAQMKTTPMKSLRDIITIAQNNNQFYQRGMHEKAQGVTRFMAETPVHERMATSKKILTALENLAKLAPQETYNQLKETLRKPKNPGAKHN